MDAPLSDDQAIDATRRWLERAVIGLNLCPFAKAVHRKGQIRFVVSEAEQPLQLHDDLVRELKRLRDSDPETIDTTLLIHPRVLGDFMDFNEFLEIADETVAELSLDGEIQVASFHPDFQFEGTAPDDITNYTNRSPFPTLHLLREASIDRAVAAFPEAASIFEANMATLDKLGHDGWRALFPEP
ncbi:MULTISPECIES: DUF1415 domain-containing protein [Rhodanobacteraceae]|uniref:DUF1415 domain-containing protein n=1 Tax=Rhodanobacteraceae TaxID=1775411 RepID=UPI00087FCF0B|nr:MULTISPECIES: DUF1415 domain-containing protein [Rhodanobacteraceae]MDR6641965.1 hypothetical protein [Luteibacter sp. 1214]SDG04825.1 hypothetical protein SAMN04515659_1975 [Dyella sp. 333MFSha]SKB29700.1 hypothetical protein SAMN05660880_00405 [Luteibacter sp. 22Crub2.1]